MNLDEKLYLTFKHDIDYISIDPEQRYGILNIDQILMRSRLFIKEEDLDKNELENIYNYFRACWLRSDSISAAYLSVKHHINSAKEIAQNTLLPEIEKMDANIETDLYGDSVDVINKGILIKNEIYYNYLSHLIGIIYQTNCIIDYSISGLKLLALIIREKLAPLNKSSVEGDFYRDTLSLIADLKKKFLAIEKHNRKDGMIIRQRNYFLHNSFIEPRMTKDTKEIILIFCNDDFGVDREGTITFSDLSTLAENIIDAIRDEFTNAVIKHLDIFMKYNQIRKNNSNKQT